MFGQVFLFEKSEEGEGGCPLGAALKIYPWVPTKTTQQRIVKMVSSGMANITFKNVVKAVHFQ